jgi:DNA-binding NarL/FixJ family response regulator
VTRVLIVEDHQVVSAGLALGLRSEGFDTRSVDGAREAVAGALADHDPEVVLLDLYLGEDLGTDLIPLLDPDARKIIVLTASTDPLLLAAALEAGAHDVLPKTAPFPRLLSGIQQVVGGGSPDVENRRQDILRDARAARREAERRLAPFAELTPREQEVLGMLMDGMQAAAIAEVSYVSLATVRSQIRSILTKLGVSSQLSAVSMAIQAGWGPEAGRSGR